MKREFKRAIGVVLMMGLLTGCGSQPFSVEGEQSAPLAALPTIGPAPTQPAGQRKTQTLTAALYFPNAARTQLVRTTQKITISDEQPRVRAMTAALLGAPEDTSLQSLFTQEVSVRQVTVCRDVVTVDLAADEAGLTEQEIVTAAAALTTTLTKVEGITYVRLLFNGREMARRGMLANPMTAPGQSLEILWMLHQKLTESPSAASRSNEVLYFKDPSGQFLMNEVRSVTVTENPVSDIVNELKKGPKDTSQMAAILPKTMTLDEYGLATDETGGQRVVVRFSYPKYETLDNRSRQMLLGSLVLSLSGRFPEALGVQIYLNGVLQDTVPGGDTVAGGLLTADLFGGLLGQSVTLYFRDEDTALLLPVSRAMSQDTFNRVQSRLEELLRGPLDSESGAAAIFPEGVTADDLLGVWNDGDCLYVNFTDRLRQACVDSDVSERMLVYGIVNTMTQFYNVRRVQFLIEGKRVSTLAGLMSVETPLLPNPGLVIE